MALFQFRKGRDEPAAPPPPAQTVEAMRRRAVHRLIGAAVLVVAGVIGFPLVFDNQPRPIPVDLPIVIPDKGKPAPLAAPPALTPSAAVASGSVQVAPPAPSAPAVTPPPPAAAPTVPAKSAPAASAAAALAAPPPKPAADATVAAPVKPPPKADDARKAQALLEGKEPTGDAAAKSAADAAGRFVVQVGAFTDAAKVREVRQKVEGAGLKTYTQVVETKDGSRTRVRVGPFADKAEATRAADKIRKLDLPVAILTL